MPEIFEALTDNSGIVNADSGKYAEIGHVDPGMVGHDRSEQEATMVRNTQRGMIRKRSGTDAKAHRPLE